MSYRPCPDLEMAIAAAHGEDREAAEALLHDVEEVLGSDEFSNYMQRPLGEIIAKLCKTLGLDPDWAVEDEDGWNIRACTPPLSHFAPTPARANGALPPVDLAPPATGPPPA